MGRCSPALLGQPPAPPPPAMAPADHCMSIPCCRKTPSGEQVSPANPGAVTTGVLGGPASPLQLLFHVPAAPDRAAWARRAVAGCG